MATGFDLLAQAGTQAGLDQIQRKRALKDSELQNQIQDLIGQRSAIVSKISSFDKGTPEYDEALNSLRQVETGLREVYHPDKNPGAIQRFGHMLTDHLGLTKSGERTEAEAAKRNKELAADQARASLEALTAAPSPTEAAKAKGTADLANLESAVKNFKILNPDASDEELNAFRSDLIQKAYGTTVRGNWTSVAGKMNGQPTSLLFDKATRQYRLQNGEPVPPEMLATFIPDVKGTESDKKRADFEAFKEDYKKRTGKDYEGTFESWTAEQSSVGRAKSKPETLDKQYQDALVKQQLGQQLTPDEQAHVAAWKLWNKETKIDPGVARAAAFGAMRYIPVVDPNNPENVVMMRAGDAARAGVNTPASIGFKTDAAITRYMTSGAGGTNINYFNTATDHLRLLGEAGEALNNGNIQLFNEYANKFATATGDPAPSNFEAVKGAVAGELSKTFKGTGATDSEIAEINQTINQAQSPQQIQGAIQYYTSLMGSKLHALQLQYEAGKSGQPNFPGAINPPATPVHPGAAGGKHKIKIGNKFYVYNGTGDTADLKNYTEVQPNAATR